MNLIVVLILYIVFRLKQFTADFLLQTAWMACNKGEPGRNGWLALAAHCSVHALITLWITLLFLPSIWWLALVDFFVHGSVDRLKARLVTSQGWTTESSPYWWSMGLDQEMHNMTHLVYIIFILHQLGWISI